MKSIFKKWIKLEPKAAYAVPEDERVHAIGDIHGRRDLFDALIAKIEADEAERGPATATIV